MHPSHLDPDTLESMEQSPPTSPNSPVLLEFNHGAKQSLVPWVSMQTVPFSPGRARCQAHLCKGQTHPGWRRMRTRNHQLPNSLHLCCIRETPNKPGGIGNGPAIATWGSKEQNPGRGRAAGSKSTRGGARCTPAR